MNTRHTLVSLFAGAGGLDIGLEMAGFRSLSINELSTHACETLRQNKILSSLSPDEFEDWFASQIQQQRCYAKSSPAEISLLRARISAVIENNLLLAGAQIVEGDIREISTKELLAAAQTKPGELTLVAGGPPCQPFSRAGKRETVETEDGRLFLEFVRVVREARPRWFLFENVKGLAQSKTLVPYFHCDQCRSTSVAPFNIRNEAILGEISSASCPTCGCGDGEIEIKEIRGGSLEIILNEFRSIGYRCHHTILNAANYGVPQNRERLFIVGSRDNEDYEWPMPTHHKAPVISTETCKERADQLALFPERRPILRPWQTMKDVLWQSGHSQFGTLDYSKAVVWVKNVVRPHAEPVSWSLDRPSPTVGAHQAAKLALAPWGVPDEQLARQQWHTKGRRQRDQPPVNVVHAMLSDEELLRLQTFPPGWYLHGTRMERAFQIGNAVPPLLAMAVGLSILKACSQKAPTLNNQSQCEAIL